MFIPFTNLLLIHCSVEQKILVRLRPRIRTIQSPFNLILILTRLFTLRNAFYFGKVHEIEFILFIRVQRFVKPLDVYNTVKLVIFTPINEFVLIVKGIVQTCFCCIGTENRIIEIRECFFVIPNKNTI